MERERKCGNCTYHKGIANWKHEEFLKKLYVFTGQKMHRYGMRNARYVQPNYRCSLPSLWDELSSERKEWIGQHEDKWR